MANVIPFRAWRYHPDAGPLENLLTQPYDKITPPMQERYLSLDPCNLVRVILGPRFPTDSESDNVYTRAARHFAEWIDRGALRRDEEPAFYACSQEFTDPDSGERILRRGFIGLGEVVDYAAGVVHRHERTLSGPKKDRLELLRHTRVHFEQLFMLYPDPEGVVDRLLEEASRPAAWTSVTDEYQAVHRVAAISDPRATAAIQREMAARKLVIADGHHRYETALAFRQENPRLTGADRVMMTFVGMHSPGLRILATHRLVNGLAAGTISELARKASGRFRVASVETPEALKSALARPDPARVRIGLASAAGMRLIECDRAPGQLDVTTLHEILLGEMLGIGEEAVREEEYLRYVRGIDAALEAVGRGAAQIAFLLQPTSIDQVAEVSFSGGVMPQKSTDFYPKLLSGLAIYRLEA